MKKILTGILIILFASQTQAASIKEEFLSPLTTNAKYVVYGGAVATAATLLFKHDTIYRPQVKIAGNQPMGSYSEYGDLLGQLVPNAAYSLGMFAYGHFSDNERANERAWSMIKATTYASIVTTVLKYTVQEERPGDGARNSFPSGHTTTAFAFASYVGAEHGWAWGIPAYLMAAGVGFSRINDNAHWMNDVVAGAAIGTAYGLGISLLNKKEREGKIKITPTLTPTVQSLNVSWDF